jgi:hypothetical protein
MLLSVGVSGRHPHDADSPGAAAGFGKLEVGPGAHRAIASSHQLELIDVIGASRQVVARAGCGQLVTVDDGVDLASAEDLEEVFPLTLAEVGLCAERAGDLLHQVGLEANSMVVLILEEIGCASFLVGSEREPVSGANAVEGIAIRGVGKGGRGDDQGQGEPGESSRSVERGGRWRAIV